MIVKWHKDSLPWARGEGRGLTWTIWCFMAYKNYKNFGYITL